MRLWIGLLLLSLSTPLFSTIIDITHTDTEYSSGNFANLQGLQWLSFDETRNIERIDIENGYGGLLESGWRYATRHETEVLINSLTENYNVNGASSFHAAGAEWFYHTIGAGFRHESEPGSFFLRNSNPWWYFGKDGDCSAATNFSCLGYYRLSWGSTDIDSNILPYSATFIDSLGLGGSYWFNDIENKDLQVNDIYFSSIGNEISSLLVRSFPVPEPGPAILLISGLIILRLERIQLKNRARVSHSRA